MPRRCAQCLVGISSFHPPEASNAPYFSGGKTGALRALSQIPTQGSLGYMGQMILPELWSQALPSLGSLLRQSHARPPLPVGLRLSAPSCSLSGARDWLPTLAGLRQSNAFSTFLPPCPQSSPRKQALGRSKSSTHLNEEHRNGERAQPIEKPTKKPSLKSTKVSRALLWVVPDFTNPLHTAFHVFLTIT